MPCHLLISDDPLECEACSREIGPGVVAMTDEIDGRRVPQCPECLECLESLDWRLAVAWSAISFHGSMRTLKRLRVMDELVDELPDVPDVTAAREELQRRLRALDDE